MAFTAITRGIALALRDPTVRQRIKRDLQASRVTREHKLDFAKYVRTQGAAALAREVGSSLGTQPAELDVALARVRSMEFYVPVPAHRASWTGGDDLIVAFQIDEDEDPIGFDLSGSPVQLSVVAPPARPVLALVPVETDFTRTVPNDWRNTDDRNGAAIGTLAPVAGARQAPQRGTGSPAGGAGDGSVSITADCNPETAFIPCDEYQGPAGHAEYPPGVYLALSRLNDLGEAWIRSSPEIELLVIGPTYNPTAQGELISCSGQNGYLTKKFQQDYPEWDASIFNVEGLILSRDEVDRYYQVYHAGYSLQIWENDQTPCEIVYTGRSTLEQLFDNLRAAYRATTLLIEVLQPTATLSISAANGNALRAYVPEALQSDDDFLGNVVYTPGSESTDAASGDAYVWGDVILTDGSSNGTVKLRTVNVSH